MTTQMKCDTCNNEFRDIDAEQSVPEPHGEIFPVCPVCRSYSIDYIGEEE